MMRPETWAVAGTRAVALLGLAGLLAIALVTVADVLARWLFSAPFAGVYDLSGLFIAVALAACFPAALAQRRNIRVTFFADLAGGMLSRVFDALASLATLVFFVLLVWQLIVYSGELLESGQTTFVLELEVAPWWVAATVLFALCLPVQALVVLVDVMAIGRPELSRYAEADSGGAA